MWKRKANTQPPPRHAAPTPPALAGRWLIRGVPRIPATLVDTGSHTSLPIMELPLTPPPHISGKRGRHQPYCGVSGASGSCHMRLVTFSNQAGGGGLPDVLFSDAPVPHDFAQRHPQPALPFHTPLLPRHASQKLPESQGGSDRREEAHRRGGRTRAAKVVPERSWKSRQMDR